MYISSYTQYGNKPCAKCTRDHLRIHFHQLQLMPTSRSRNVLVVSPRNGGSRVCILLNMSCYIAGRRYPSSISFTSRLNYTCGVLRSFDCSLYFRIHISIRISTSISTNIGISKFLVLAVVLVFKLVFVILPRYIVWSYYTFWEEAIDLI